MVTRDIDLWLEKIESAGLRKALAKVNGIYVPPVMLNPPMLAGDAVKLFDLVSHMHGLGEFSDEWENTIEVKLGRCTVRVLKLSRIIASKKAANREKDRLVLPVLEDLAAVARPASRRRTKPRGKT
ncbi:MAG: hypothetical protein V1929_11925 [bacterium]